MSINNLLRENNNFTSIIPGAELTRTIEDIVKYCQENNVTSTLEFNGVTNRIESWIDPHKLANAWYKNPTDMWYQSQKMELRDKKINEILK